MGIYLKNEGGDPFQSNFSATKDTSQNLTTFDPMSQKYLASVFQNYWHKIHFLFHFHVCYFSNNGYELIKLFYVVYLHFQFQVKKIKLMLVKSPKEFLCFSSLWIINTEKVSLLFMGSVKKGVLKNDCL